MCPFETNMLIPFVDFIRHYGLDVRGIIHVGAHDCEEQESYDHLLPRDNVYWFEAMQTKVDSIKRAHPDRHIYQAVVTNRDNDEVTFYHTNNGQSSSILEMDTHRDEHPGVIVDYYYTVKTSRLDTLIERHGIPIESVNVLNLDIQGVEYEALEGMLGLLGHIDIVYSEVNTRHLYKNCKLMSDLDALLEPLGFARVVTKMTQHHWGDAIYVKRHLVEGKSAFNC